MPASTRARTASGVSVAGPNEQMILTRGIRFSLGAVGMRLDLRRKRRTAATLP